MKKIIVLIGALLLTLTMYGQCYETMLKKGDALKAQGKYSQAIECYQDAKGCKPTNEGVLDARISECKKAMDSQRNTPAPKKNTPVYLPTVTTYNVFGVESDRAQCGGRVTSSGGASVTAYGVCWSTSPNPTISNYSTNDGRGTEDFNCTMTNLKPGTTYYVRAYATNSKGTAYGEEVSFKSETMKPSVSTLGIESINSRGAICRGSITNTGGSDVTSYGFCWSETNPSPTLQDRHYAITSQKKGIFDFKIGLDREMSSDTKYYTRAFATNSVGTAYGDVIEFTTRGIDVSFNKLEIELNRRTVQCKYQVDLTSTNTTCGICWSERPQPTMTDKKIYTVCTPSKYISGDELRGISNDKTYYIRPFANCRQDTIYGVELAFRVSSDAVKQMQSSEIRRPVVSLVNVSSVSSYKYMYDFDIIDSGKTLHSLWGACWSQDPQPTVSKDHSAIGNKGPIIGLASNTDYYLRTFVICENDTFYGKETKFRTKQITSCDSYVEDFEGNKYRTVQIGCQCWMAENLKTKFYEDGTPIPHKKGTVLWYYPDGKSFKEKEYGLLYASPTIVGESKTSTSNDENIHRICPQGWHVPSTEDWMCLNLYAQSRVDVTCDSNYEYVAKALSSQTKNWASSSLSCTPGEDPSSNNALGFSALPAGKYSDDYYYYFGQEAYFWSSEKQYWKIKYGGRQFLFYSKRYSDRDRVAFSVRCLRD